MTAKNGKKDGPIRKSIENKCHKEPKKIEKAPPQKRKRLCRRSSRFR